MRSATAGPCQTTESCRPRQNTSCVFPAKDSCQDESEPHHLFRNRRGSSSYLKVCSGEYNMAAFRGQSELHRSGVQFRYSRRQWDRMRRLGAGAWSRDDYARRRKAQGGRGGASLWILYIKTIGELYIHTTARRCFYSVDCGPLHS